MQQDFFVAFLETRDSKPFIADLSYTDPERSVKNSPTRSASQRAFIFQNQRHLSVRRFRQMLNTASPSGYKIILDLPSDNPTLGFADCARALAEIAEQSTPQFAIGIFGTWGSGKTTLMHAIERQLSQRTISVQFNAWRYEKEEHLIVPLLDCVREGLLSWSKTQPVQLQERVLGVAGTIGRAIRSVLAGLSVKAGPPGVEFSFDANKTLSALDHASEDEKQAKVPGSFYYATFAALSDAFKTFLGAGSNERIVVFIDDLDRCLPEAALDVLEAMKLFFDLPGFVFIVGLDQQVIERSIDVKYRSSPSSANDGADKGYQIRGKDYIKKIFQVPFAVAPVAMSQLEEFLRAVYAEAALPADQVSEFQNVVTRHLRYTLAETAVNPRELKRYLNAYTLTRKVKPSLFPDVTLAIQTVGFRPDWEIVQRALISYGDIFTDAVKRQIVDGETSAIRDLDETLAAVPDTFLNYVGSTEPGEQLLSVANLDEYIYSGEATRSSLGTLLLDPIRSVAKLSQLLRALRAAPVGARDSAIKPYADAVMSAVSKISGVSDPHANRVGNAWSTHTTSGTPRLDDDSALSTWCDEQDRFRKTVLNRLMEIYRSSALSTSAA